MFNSTPPSTQPPHPASGATGPAGLRLWGPPWLTALFLTLFALGFCFISYLTFVLIGTGSGEDLALVLRAAAVVLQAAGDVIARVLKL